jgi:Fe2+ or Zn2+ uptake regulation protein
VAELPERPHTQPDPTATCEHHYVEDEPMHSHIKWLMCTHCGHVDEASLSEKARARLDEAGWFQ